MSEMDELAALIARYAVGDGIHPTALPRVHLIRSSRPTEPLYALYEPALIIVAQGRKQVMIGPHVYLYDLSQYLIVSVDVPVTAQVLEGTPERPYLCLRLDLDLETLGSLILESGPLADTRVPAPGVTLSTVTPELRDAAVRLLRLLATPRDIPALAPLAEREILYRLVAGEQAAALRQIALGDGKLRRVARAIDWLKRNYREPFRIEALAAAAAMSPSALHARFKAVTAMSPLQYQKQLRLQEARRLMLGQAMDAASAAYDVGYESPSQFSREYRRLFGHPPARDIARLKSSPAFAESA
jgi:AraC-like DNA-binding protein